LAVNVGLPQQRRRVIELNLTDEDVTRVRVLDVEVDGEAFEQLVQDVGLPSHVRCVVCGPDAPLVVGLCLRQHALDGPDEALTRPAVRKRDEPAQLPFDRRRRDVSGRLCEQHERDTRVCPLHQFVPVETAPVREGVSSHYAVHVRVEPPLECRQLVDDRNRGGIDPTPEPRDRLPTRVGSDIEEFDSCWPANHVR